MRVYLFGWFGYKNLGDDLLLSVMLHNLSGVAERVEVCLKECEYLQQFLVKYPEAFADRRSIFGLFKAALWNDCLIIGPGGLFPHPNLMKTLVFFMVTLWWKLLGRRVIWFCFGASRRQNPVSSMLWRVIARLADLFISRDDNIFTGANISLSNTAFVATDVVFSLATSDAAKRLSDRAAVCFANLYETGEEGYATFLEGCEKVAMHIREKGLEVDLLSFTAGSDERLNSDIAKHVQGCRTFSYEQSLKAVRDGLRYRIVVGMRFHSVVLGLLGGSPVVPIAYADKTEVLAREAGIEDRLTYFCKGGGEYFGRVISLDSERISAAVDSALAAEEDKYRIETIVSDKRRVAMNAFMKLKRTVGGG